MAPTVLQIGAAYIRVSTDDQTELSPDAQLRVIKEEATRDGFVIPPEYIFVENKGISGRKASNRPEFQRMVSIAKSQSPAPFKRLYLWKFSRFARNQEESTFYKSILRKKCGVEIKSVSEPIMEGMFGRLIETIIEWFDEYYSYNLSGEVIRGMTEKALRQGYQMTPPLGYKAVGEGKPFAINEDAYKIVEFIFKSYAAGMDMSAITRYCNEHRWKTQRGNPFERRGIQRILKNHFYIGEVEWNGYKFQGPHETRSSVKDCFEIVQKRIQDEYKPANRRDASESLHWLAGIMVCGTCGATLGYNRVFSGKRPSYYQCWKYAKGMHAGSCSITAVKAERLLLQSLNEVLSSQAVEYEHIQQAHSDTISERELIEAAIERVAVKEQRVKEAYEAGIDTLEEYKGNKLRLAEEREDLRMKLENISPAADPDDPGPDEVLSRIKNIYDLISSPDVDDETKGKAIRRIVKKIVLDKEKGEFKVVYYA